MIHGSPCGDTWRYMEVHGDSWRYIKMHVSPLRFMEIDEGGTYMEIHGAPWRLQRSTPMRLHGSS